LGAFWVTALREAKRPQRKLFEPEGRVFAPAVKPFDKLRAVSLSNGKRLERSKTVYSQEESGSSAFGQQPVDSRPHQPDIPAPDCFPGLILARSQPPTNDQPNAWIGYPGDHALLCKG